jgi:hypothetical protein
VPGKSAQEAVDRFVGFIRETLNCITSAQLKAHRDSENLFKLFFEPAARVLAKNGEKFYISIAQTFTVEQREDGQFKAHTRQYSYVFSTTQGTDHHGRIAYHWHPDDFQLREPHLHISLTPTVGYPPIDQKISRAHFPTSRVCLEDFVEFLIRYYDIKPPIAEREWKRILKKNKSAFAAQATWFVKPAPATEKPKKRSKP